MPHSSFRAVSWTSVFPAAVVVALSLQACGADDAQNLATERNGTDPSCRPLTCSTLGKNCGVVSDGCGGTLRCGTCAGTNNDCRVNVCERSCSSSSECADGTACVNGSCTDKCSSSQDCPSGQYCSSGSCIAKAPSSCSYDSNCRSDERCMSGQCIGERTGSDRACYRDSECSSAEACLDHVCSPIGGRACYRSSDCYSDETCLRGYCSRSNGSSTCSSDYDCRSSERCSYGLCRRDDNRRVRAECVTRELGLSLPFGDLTFYSENWVYENGESNGSRVESCICTNSGVLKLDLGDTTRSINCASCIKDGSVRTCYQ